MSSALFAGPYELLRRLSAGGMGEVFIGRRKGQGDFEKQVALKLLLPHLVSDAEFTQRFFDEARLVARMNHPNIVQLFDVGDADGRPYLAMALIEGLSLNSLLKAARAKGKMLPMSVVRLLAVSLLDALAYAHALTGPKGEKLNVVHRDVTPSNVMVSSAGAVMLTDFGIASSRVNLHRTQPGRVRGKFAYMAPEHASERPLDHRADLFSAAATLYEALTLQSPFARQGDVATMEAVVSEAPAPPSSLRADASPEFSRALLKALEKDPADRFPSARAMREAMMDGPVASAPELAELFARLCGAEVRERFGGTVGHSELPGTISVPSPAVPRGTSAPQALALARPRWRLMLLLGAGAGMAFAAVMVAVWPAPEPADVPVEPPRPAELADVPVEPDAGVARAAWEAPAQEPADSSVRLLTTLFSDAGVAGRTGVLPGRPPHKPVGLKPGEARDRPLERLPAAPDIKVGYLTADAQPWANVLIDGRPADRTPVSRFPVPVGAHTLLFRSADGREVERKIKVQEGQVVVLERVDF